MRKEWHELWATFSVKDHCTSGAFVAEALLYDHLLIPVVPMRRDRLSPEEADYEWQRWRDNGWEPARLNQLLGTTRFTTHLRMHCWLRHMVSLL